MKTNFTVYHTGRDARDYVFVVMYTSLHVFKQCVQEHSNMCFCFCLCACAVPAGMCARGCGSAA